MVTPPKDWEPDFVYQGMRGMIFSSPTGDAPSVRQCVAGVSLPGVVVQDNWFQVRLPDDEVGYLRTQGDLHLPKDLADRILFTGERFLGTSYIWGGKTALGCDCSGFVQTVFWLNGVNLPRDSWQQAEKGKEISAEQAEAGDLFFFAEKDRVSHVGIAYNSHRFIHSSGFVRINSLDRNADDYSPKHASTFMTARRLLH